MRGLALPLLGLVLVAPAAIAHPGDMSGVFGVYAEGLGVSLRTETLVVKAHREVLFNGSVLSNATGPPKEVLAPDVQLEITGPGLADLEVTPHARGFEARVLFPAPGEWTVHAHYEGQLRRIPIHVYPPSSLWMESSNLRTNYHYAKQPVTANLFFLDEATSVVVNATQPARGLLTRVVNGSHVDAEEVELPPGPMGSVVFSRTFFEPGEFTLAVASEEHGIVLDGLPEISFRVKEPFAGMATARTPGIGAAPLVALAAGLALAWAWRGRAA